MLLGEIKDGELPKKSWVQDALDHRLKVFIHGKGQQKIHDYFENNT